MGRKTFKTEEERIAARRERHSRLSMTQRYLHIVSDDVINAFK